MKGFTYKSYNFIDKDPFIDLIRTVIQESQKSIKSIALESGVNENTIRNWLYGETKRPQAASINAVLRVCLYKLGIVGINDPLIIEPTPIEPKHRTPTNIKYLRNYHIKTKKRK